MRNFRFWSLVAAVCLLLAIPVAGDEITDRRLHAGTRLFRSLLAADLDLAKKTVDNNQLLVVFFYVNDQSRAQELAARFASDAKDVRGLSVVTELTNDPAFKAYGKRTPAAVFIAQPPNPATLKSLVKYGIDRRVIVYSPFEGHVESGVTGGLSVEAQVRPFVNATTLAASHISLKDFFLKVTKVYP